MTAARIDLIHDLVSSAAATTPDRPAIITSDGMRTTFVQFDRQIDSVAAWVNERTQRGDRVAVIADNSASYALLYYGVPRSGRVLTLINQRLSPGEQIGQLASAEARILLGDARYLTALPDVTGRAPPLNHVLTFEDPGWQRAVDESGSLGGSIDPDEPAWLLFTSGSTGTPKGVLHTHRSITTAVRGTMAGRSVRSGGVYLLPFPMCHIAGYNMLVHHCAHSTVLPVGAFRPDEFVAAVNAHHVTSCSLAPTMLHALLAHLEQTGSELPTLRDASILATAGRPHDEVDIRVAADDGGIGEILVRGAQVAAGYWPGPIPVSADGWLPTGDVGRIDGNGRLVIVDRSKDVVITGGENVSSRAVEDVLSTHPGVDQVAVVGVPDEYWGEAICAVVVVRAGSELTGEDVIAHARAHLAAFKRPRHVLFVDSLPLTSNGKVAKDVVRQDARRRLSQG